MEMMRNLDDKRFLKTLGIEMFPDMELGLAEHAGTERKPLSPQRGNVGKVSLISTRLIIILPGKEKVDLDIHTPPSYSPEIVRLALRILQSRVTQFARTSNV